jgi:hypothetical protein
MTWSWIVLALIVLVVTSGEACLAKPIALNCGFAVLIPGCIHFSDDGVLHRKRVFAANPHWARNNQRFNHKPI